MQEFSTKQIKPLGGLPEGIISIVTQIWTDPALNLGHWHGQVSKLLSHFGL